MHYIISRLFIITLLVVNQKYYWKSDSVIRITLKRDIIISMLCVVASFTSIELQNRKEENYQKFSIGSLDQAKIDQINYLDRSAAGRWDLIAKDNGKTLMNMVIYIAPLSLLLFRGSIKERLGLFFIFTQGYILAETITGIVKGLVERYRPFAFRGIRDIQQLGVDAKEKFFEDIASFDIKNSFFSGDAALTAFGFTFFAFAFQEVYSASKLKKFIWGFCLLTIAAECYYRTMSGKHFPSDVLVGAIVGGAIAFGIIQIHLTRKKSIDS